MSVTELRRGDLFIAYPAERLAHQHLVSVTRVSRDGSWADIQVRTWAVMWTKRQPLVNGRFKFPHEPYRPGSFDFHRQMADHDAMLREERQVSS